MLVEGETIRSSQHQQQLLGRVRGGGGFWEVEQPSFNYLLQVEDIELEWTCDSSVDEFQVL